MVTAAEVLRAFRVKTGLSCRALALKYGMAVNAFLYYESGKRHPSPRRARKIIEIAKKDYGITLRLEDLMPR